MIFTETEKENLLGPLVVGMVFGALTALALVAFDSEYGPHLYAESQYSLLTISIFHALVAFLSVTIGVVFLFGYLPIVLPRIISRIRGTGDGHA